MSDSGLPPKGGTDRDRWISLLLIVFLALLIGGGLWLANALSSANKTLECVESGRTNCNPIDTTPR